MKKSVIKIFILGIFLAIALIFLNNNFVLADNNVCCERLSTGQWCQSAPVEACDSDYRKAPTSCESTTFCSVGTCYDSQEGICESKVSQIVCNNDGGVWSEKDPEELPQCQVGCCLLGAKGANLATQSRCKELSSLYGVKTNFNPGITNELECIASTGGDEKGACVYEAGSERTCRLLTRAECGNLQENVTTTNTPEFYEGYLCSDENLGTNCGPTRETTCVVGEDEVRFVDSCGNLANIYDSSKIEDKAYWSQIIQKEDSCNFEKNNANSASCGNCDFGLGSTCKAYERGDPAKPLIGENLCRDLGCSYEGIKYKHGEQWCGEAPGTPKLTDPDQDGNYVFNGKDSKEDVTKENLPGSVFTKLTCYNNEVTVDNCYDGRQKVCIQSEINGFKNAQCMVNTWQECYGIKNEEECMDRNNRKCLWIDNTYGLGTQKTDGKSPVFQPSGLFVNGNEPGPGACVPLNAPGFDFWAGEGNGENICSLGTIMCDYHITYSLIDRYEFEKGSECIVSAEEDKRDIRPDWLAAANSRCVQIGDCGPKTNFLGYAGEKQTIAEKIFGGKNAVGDYVKADGKTIWTPEGAYTTWSQYFNSFNN
ncbi:MAG: hypothetical protein Q8Q04_02610 [archaeon]|nr:hypothetical protein [archaeon]